MASGTSHGRFIRRWRVSDYAADRKGFEAAFLETVSRLVPRVVSSLRRDVLPVFKELETLADRAADPIIAADLQRQFEAAGEPAPLIGVFDRSNVLCSERPYRLKIRWSALRVDRQAKARLP